MRCQVCGADDTEVVSEVQLDEWSIERTRRCERGHESKTYEVLPAVWSSARWRHKEHIDSLDARFNREARNKAILADLERGRPVHAIAKQQGVSVETIYVLRRKHASR